MTDYVKLLMSPLPIEEFQIPKGVIEGIDTDFVVNNVWFGQNPKSHLYGKIVCEFKYKSHNYTLYFHVHRPKQKYSCLSNKPESIMEVLHKSETIHGETFSYSESVDTSFGFKAFWGHTPIDCLDPESYMVRLLINNIIAYSRRNNLCKQLRKTDAQALRLNAMFREG